MSKSYIICHTMTSLDGGIDCAMAGQPERDEIIEFFKGEFEMKKTLVAYFSASGTTAHAGKRDCKGRWEQIYMRFVRPKSIQMADLDWTDKKSRSTAEDERSSLPPGDCGNS